MYRILLVEDTREYQLLVQRTLTNLEADLTVASGVSEAIQLLKNSGDQPFDLLILDLTLPDGEGLSVLEYLNSTPAFSDTAVFLLTGNDDLSVKVAAFHLGAEDYLLKSMNPIELRARIEMKLKKVSIRKKTSHELTRGELRFEPALMKVSLNNGKEETTIDLTGKEFKILYFLARNETAVFSRADLVKEVWGPKIHVLERTVDSHICAIRRKLGDYIESVPGVGYRFSQPVSKSHSGANLHQSR